MGDDRSAGSDLLAPEWPPRPDVGDVIENEYGLVLRIDEIEDQPDGTRSITKATFLYINAVPRS